jgi:transglutaminase-like putative cysteine protease
MSTVERPAVALPGAVGTARVLALVSGLGLVGAATAPLYGVTRVVGGATLLVVLVAAALVLATALALLVRPAFAAVVGAVLLVGGAVVYLQAAPLGWTLLGDVGKVWTDALALSTGISLLRMRAAGAWALGFAPAPAFLSWYLLVRRHYGLGVAAAGVALFAFVLTTDAGATTTLAGAVAGAATLGFGELDRRDAGVGDLDLLVVLLTLMVVATTALSVVPGSGAGPVFPDRSSPSVEANLVGADERFGVVGSVSLDPEVRFVVESEQAAYWRVGAYDRYTGQGWVRSRPDGPYEEPLARPRGGGETVVQRVQVRSSMQVLPAAYKPRRVAGDVDGVRATSTGGLRTTETLTDGDDYVVESTVPSHTERELRTARVDAPQGVRERYTQLPDDTPEQLTTFTDRLTAGSSGPYESASRIERWLERNKGYSLNVSRPDGQVASSFVFDMEEGYCVYFASAMAAMLRTQDVPARMVVGYTPGQQVGPDEYVVRGLDAHAWVEVYLGDLGWVRFDPTPGGPREAAEGGRVEDAREAGRDDVDAAGSENGEWTPTPDPTTTDTPTSDPGGGGTPAVGTPGGAGAPDVTPVDSPTGGDGGPTVPREWLGLGLVVVAGAAAGVRRAGGIGGVRRMAGLYVQRPGGDPTADVRRATERLEWALGRHRRPRDPGESRAAYLRTMAVLEGDEALREVGLAHQRAVYGPGVDRATAEEVRAVVDERVRRYSLSRLRRLARRVVPGS